MIATSEFDQEDLGKDVHSQATLSSMHIASGRGGMHRT